MNILFLIIICVIISFSCGRDDRKELTNQSFGWKEKVSVGDIPNFPVKGYLGGREINFEYINFERWRGSNDNVINFSTGKPSQNCGYVENFNGFSLVKKGGDFAKGQWVKGEFTDTADSIEAYYYMSGLKSNAGWNCALIIEDIDERKVRGRILLCFGDENKNWAGGIFEAIICNN